MPCDNHYAMVPSCVHGDPFGNIAHGCNTILSSRLALKLCDRVVAEADFASDPGADSQRPTQSLHRSKLGARIYKTYRSYQAKL